MPFSFLCWIIMIMIGGISDFYPFSLGLSHLVCRPVEYQDGITEGSWRTRKTYHLCWSSTDTEAKQASVSPVRWWSSVRAQLQCPHAIPGEVWRPSRGGVTWGGVRLLPIYGFHCQGVLHWERFVARLADCKNVKFKRKEQFCYKTAVWQM